MANLKVSPENAVRQIQERIDAIATIQKNGSGLEYYDIIRWCSTTWQVIDGIYGSDDPHSEELRTMALQNCSCNAPMAAVILAEAYHNRLQDFIDQIRNSGKTPE